MRKAMETRSLRCQEAAKAPEGWIARAREAGTEIQRPKAGSPSSLWLTRSPGLLAECEFSESDDADQKAATLLQVLAA